MTDAEIGWWIEKQDFNGADCYECDECGESICNDGAMIVKFEDLIKLLKDFKELK